MGRHPSAQASLETDYEPFMLFFQAREALLAEIDRLDITLDELGQLMPSPQCSGSWISQVLAGSQNTMGRGISMSLRTLANLAAGLDLRVKIELVPLPKDKDNVTTAVS